MESLRLHLLGLCSKQVLAVVMLWQGSLWDVRAQNELVFRKWRVQQQEQGVDKDGGILARSVSSLAKHSRDDRDMSRIH